LSHVLEFDVQNEFEFERGTGVVMCLTSNGGASFAISRIGLLQQGPLSPMPVQNAKNENED
jgi:hypothetical protein